MSVSSSTMSVGVMAIFSGLLGAYGLRAVLLGDDTPPPPPQPTIVVPLAAADLPEGREIALSDIVLQNMTREQMDQAGFNTTEVMLSTEFLVGRTLQKPTSKDQPFLTSALYLEGTGENIAELLMPGERAVSVEVAKRRGGHLAPGTTVDVVFRSEAQPESETQPAIPETTVVLFSGVRVVAVEKPKKSNAQDNPNLDLRLTNGAFLNIPQPKPIVTLAVNLGQANMLQTVEGRGELTLLPVGVQKPQAASDGGLAVTDVAQSTQSASSQMTLEQLLNVQVDKPFQTEIYRAGNRDANHFDKNGVIDPPKK